MAGNASLNPAPPRAGELDHDLYDRRRITGTGAVHWPQGHPAAAFILVHLEALELEPPDDAVRDPGLRGGFGSFFPAYREHSLIEYGNRIGIFRLLDMLQPMGWTVAVAVNGHIAHNRPSLLRALTGRGVELLASGWSASRMISGAMSLETERELLTRSVEAFSDATGQRPRGYASQDYGYSGNTAGLLEELALEHVVDWPNDERPFRFGPSRRLVMLPAAAELDDAQVMLARRLKPRAWGAEVDTALTWWEDSALPGSVLALPLHAWVAGSPHRAAVLRRALTGHPADGFWQAGPGAVAAAWRAAQSRGAGHGAP